MVQQIIPDGQHVQDLILNGIMLQRTGRTVLKIFQVKSFSSHLKIQMVPYYFMVVFHCKATFKLLMIFVATTDEASTAAPSTAAPSTEAPSTTETPAGGKGIFLE